MLTPKHRPVSHSRSSNRTCPFRASGFPMDFTARLTQCAAAGQAEGLGVRQRSADSHSARCRATAPYGAVSGNAVRDRRRNVDFSIRRGAGAVGKVGRPASENLIEAGAHFFPCSNVSGHQEIYHFLLDALPAASLAIAETVRRLGLEPFRAPEPLPPIQEEDIHLICWMAVDAAD